MKFENLKLRIVVSFMTWVLIITGGLCIYGGHSVEGGIALFRYYADIYLSGGHIKKMVDIFMFISSYFVIFFLGIFVEVFLDWLENVVLEKPESKEE